MPEEKEKKKHKSFYRNVESFFIFGFGFVLQEKLYADDYTNIVANAVRVLMIIVCVTSFD